MVAGQVLYDQDSTAMMGLRAVSLIVRAFLDLIINLGNIPNIYVFVWKNTRVKRNYLI